MRPNARGRHVFNGSAAMPVVTVRSPTNACGPSRAFPVDSFRGAGVHPLPPARQCKSALAHPVPHRRAMPQPTRTPPVLPGYIGSRRTLMRFGSTTTTAPASRSASTDAMFASSIERRVAGLRSGRPRKRMKDGLAASRSASNAPKSVSSETSTRSSFAANSNIVGSSSDWRPNSRTCTASWPAARRPSANRGDNALSTRNFRPRRPEESAARQLPRPHNGELPRCPRVRGPGNRPTPVPCSCPVREDR